MNHHKPLALLVVAAAALSACGSTVATSSRVAAGGGGVGTQVQGGTELGGELGAGLEAGGGAGMTDSLGAGAGGEGDLGTGPSGAGAASGTQSGQAQAPGSTASGSAGGAGGGGQAAAPPTRRVTSLISVGFIVEQGDGQQANTAAGVETGQNVTLGKLYRSLIAEFNDKGGLAGRKIAPVYHSVNPAAPSYDAELASACAAFTQDNRVAAVLDTIGFAEAYEQCLAKGGAFHVTGSGSSPAKKSLSQVPSVMAVAAPAIERRERAVVEHLAANGTLKRGTKVGVIVDSCPATQVGYEQGFLPAAEQVGLQLEKVDVNCASGYDDLGPMGAALQNAVLRFQSAGVTVVAFVSNVAPTEAILFTQAAENQGYRPGYALTSNAQPIALALNVPPAQLRNMRGIGWLPSLDVGVSKVPQRSAPQGRCLAMLKAQGVVPASDADFYLAYTVCESVFALERLLQDSSGVSDRAVLVQVARALGTGYPPVITFADRFSPDGLDGPTSSRTFRYDQDCSCFAYDGAVQPLR